MIYCLAFAQSPRREEKGISFTVFLASFGIVLRWVEIFPHAHGVDVFVLLVPPTVHHFEQSRVAVESFQVGVGDCGGLLFELVGGQETTFGLWRWWQRAICCWDEVCRCRCCWFRGEWEEDAVVAGEFVEDESVEVEML
jgi:hypothetical protein